MGQFASNKVPLSQGVTPQGLKPSLVTIHQYPAPVWWIKCSLITHCYYVTHGWNHMQKNHGVEDDPPRPLIKFHDDRIITFSSTDPVPYSNLSSLFANVKRSLHRWMLAPYSVHYSVHYSPFCLLICNQRVVLHQLKFPWVGGDFPRPWA